MRLRTVATTLAVALVLVGDAGVGAVERRSLLTQLSRREEAYLEAGDQNEMDQGENAEEEMDEEQEGRRVGEAMEGRQGHVEVSFQIFEQCTLYSSLFWV